jgi:hypothetical protein
VVSIVILVHVLAVLAGAFAAPPSSELEHHLADFFVAYHQLVDQGDAYRYYSTAFPPTPVVTATLTFDNGQPDKIVRIPDRSARPRLLKQRQLAMAHFLKEDFEAAKDPHYLSGLIEDAEPPRDRSRSLWAHAFASHLAQTNPGCNSVTLSVETHQVPRLDRVQEILGQRAGPVDLDADEFLMAPERIGVYR